jgi:hypothetical protein
MPTAEDFDDPEGFVAGRPALDMSALAEELSELDKEIGEFEGEPDSSPSGSGEKPDDPDPGGEPGGSGPGPDRPGPGDPPRAG